MGKNEPDLAASAALMPSLSTFLLVILSVLALTALLVMRETMLLKPILKWGSPQYKFSSSALDLTSCRTGAINALLMLVTPTLMDFSISNRSCVMGSGRSKSRSKKPDPVHWFFSKYSDSTRHSLGRKSESEPSKSSSCSKRRIEKMLTSSARVCLTNQSQRMMEARSTPAR